MMTRTLKGDEYASSHTKYRSRRVTSRRWSERLFIASPSLSVPCLSVWSVHRLPDDRVPLNRLLIPLTPWKDSSGIRWRRRRRWWSDPDRSWASVQWFLLNVGKACNFISNVFIIPYFCFVFAGLKFKLGLLNQHHFLSALSSFVGLMWTKDENTKNRESWRGGMEREKERERSRKWHQKARSIRRRTAVGQRIEVEDGYRCHQLSSSASAPPSSLLICFGLHPSASERARLQIYSLDNGVLFWQRIIPFIPLLSSSSSSSSSNFYPCLQWTDGRILLPCNSSRFCPSSFSSSSNP